MNSLGNKHKGEKQLKENPLTSGTFYLMTDALAEWFLNEKDNAISKIEVWQNQKDFERFVDEERHNEKLGNDDSAILTIKIEEDKKEQVTYVLEDVSDIIELIKVQQKEIEVSEKVKEQELILQKENSNSEITTEQIQQAEPVENKLSEEVETEIEKPKKGFFKRIFGKEENEMSNEKEEIETDEKVEVAEEHQEEKEPSTQGEENNIEIENSEDSEKNESQESESKSKEVPESNTKSLNKPSQNITDKF